MDAKLLAFRKRAREENGGRSRIRRRYSRELRLEAVSYLNRRKRAGATLRDVAAELGVSGWSLSRWVRDSEKRAGLVPVELSEREERTSPILVTPRGYRIEGLSEESLARLVERVG